MMSERVLEMAAAAFVALMVEERLSDHPEADDCGAVVDLEGALKTVWWSGALVYTRRIGEDGEGRARKTLVRRDRYHTAVAELLEATKGQPFRIDTEAGPLFVQGCLWRFAGQSGGCFEGDADCPWKPKTPPPAWGSEWLLPSAAAKAAKARVARAA